MSGQASAPRGHILHHGLLAVQVIVVPVVHFLGEETHERHGGQNLVAVHPAGVVVAQRHRSDERRVGLMGQLKGVRQLGFAGFLQDQSVVPEPTRSVQHIVPVQPGQHGGFLPWVIPTELDKLHQLVAHCFKAVGGRIVPAALLAPQLGAGLQGTLCGRGYHGSLRADTVRAAVVLSEQNLQVLLERGEHAGVVEIQFTRPGSADRAVVHRRHVVVLNAHLVIVGKGHREDIVLHTARGYLKAMSALIVVEADLQPAARHVHFGQQHIPDGQLAEIADIGAGGRDHRQGVGAAVIRDAPGVRRAAHAVRRGGRHAPTGQTKGQPVGAAWSHVHMHPEHRMIAHKLREGRRIAGHAAHAAHGCVLVRVGEVLVGDLAAPFERKRAIHVRRLGLVELLAAVQVQELLRQTEFVGL
mmetsp:Transcript_13552/g.23769  ORF Transcript_13552/g.23769 Transcript_13552/m.23769 type:complete len:413 (+) Transcript_13552:434-1672(+)